MPSPDPAPELCEECQRELTTARNITDGLCDECLEKDRQYVVELEQYEMIHDAKFIRNNSYFGE